MKKDIITCIFLLALIGTLVWGIMFIYKADFSGFRKDNVTETEDNNETILDDEKNIDKMEDKEEIKKEDKQESGKDKESTNDNKKNDSSASKKPGSSGVEPIPDDLYDIPDISDLSPKINVISTIETNCNYNVKKGGIHYMDHIEATFDKKNGILISIKMEYILDFYDIKEDFTADETEELKETFLKSMPEIKGFSYRASNTGSSFGVVYEGKANTLKSVYPQEFSQTGVFIYANYLNRVRSDGFSCQTANSIRNVNG